MKKVLILASVASMIDKFNRPNIKLLIEMGYEAHVACNFRSKNNVCSGDSLQQLKKDLNEMGVLIHTIDFSREILDMYSNYRAYKQVCRLLKKENYEWVHCHSPIGGAIGRIAVYRTASGRRRPHIIYTAHGFHFYRGGPLVNWILFYPVEAFLAGKTDVLITINQEDFRRAKQFRAKKVYFIPGVGIDWERFSCQRITKKELRKKYGVPLEKDVILSVGELNRNKNHKVIIEAIAKSNRKSIHYLICGQGKIQKELEDLAKKLGVSDQVQFLGYQEKVEEIYNLADLFVLPSKREGLCTAGLEAMASGLAVVASNCRGIRDYIKNGENGYLIRTNDVNGFAKGIEYLLKHQDLRRKMGKQNQKKAAAYDIRQTQKFMRRIYQETEHM